jgi:hypothetical protein
MDWPVVGAISGVAVAAAAVLGLGAYIIVDSSQSAGARATAPAAPAARERLSYTNWAGEQYAAPAPSRVFVPAPVAAPFSPAAVPSDASIEFGAERPAIAGPRQERVKPPRPAVVKPAPQEREEPIAKLREEPVKPARPVVARPAPEPPQERPQVQDPRLAKVLTPAKVAHVRATLRLTPEQAQHWPPVAASLHEIGREQMQLASRGHEPEVGMGSMYRLYSAAGPLLSVLQPDQKERIRGLARSLGYGSLASRL